MLVAIGLLDARLKLVLGEGARRVADHPFLVGELRLEIERILPVELGDRCRGMGFAGGLGGHLAAPLSALMSAFRHVLSIDGPMASPGIPFDSIRSRPMTLAMAKAPTNPVHGWLVLDKPHGMNSTKAVAIAKRLFRADKCGHAGTLDPLASGMLPIAFGEATKTVQYAQDGEKQYRFTVKWGEERSTDDLEGEVTQISADRPTRVRIESILKDFTGEISQIPPAFSAIKVEGERSYDLARAGDAVALKARPVTIKSLALAACDTDTATFETTCGKGTYIRALARDMGRVLGCCGHVIALRRTAVGPFREADMIPLDKLEELSHKAPGGDAITGLLRPLETVLDGIPAWPVKDAEAQRLRQGQPVLLRGANAPIASDAVLVTWGSIPLGICSIEQGSLKPRRLFNLS